jgi:hypothetical protein
MPVMPAPRKLRQEGHKFEACVGFIMSLRLT